MLLRKDSRKQRAKFDELDPCVIGCEPRTAPVKELKSFTVDPHDATKTL